MYFSFGMKNGDVRWFWIYRIFSFYPYMIVITIMGIDSPHIPDPEERRDIMLETKTGLSILIYTWIAGFIWPYVIFTIAYHDIIRTKTFDIRYRIRETEDNSTARDLISLIGNGRYAEVQQLLRFGYVAKKNYRGSSVKCHT